MGSDASISLTSNGTKCLSPIQGHHDELEGIVALLKGQIEDLQRQLQEAETLNVRLQAR